MEDELLKIRRDVEKSCGASRVDTVPVYPGIELVYLELESDSFSVRHGSADHIMQINYCKSGQMAWKMKNGSHIYLNPGDFSVHMMNICTDSSVSFPGGHYSGLVFYIDLKKITADPPEMIRDAGIFHESLAEKFCRSGSLSFFAGNEQTKGIFSAFYDQPEHLRLPYQKIKAMELFLYLSKLSPAQHNQLESYRSDQVEIVREIHDRLTGQMGERITIEELSRQYLINPTTLKAAFKSVYGASIAAHIKEHRMEQAAKMLRESDMSIAQIAQAVGYDSQSKFTAAFKAFFQVLPREYKKNL